MKDNISPEEKLLRLIRGRKKQDTVKVIDTKPALANSVVSQDLKLSFKSPAFLSSRKYLSFLSFKKIILIVFVISCIYSAGSFIYPWLGESGVKLPEITENKAFLPQIEPEPEAKPYEFYLEGIKNRRVFSSMPTRETEVPATSVNNNAGLIKDINLVGIISGEDPQAVIEDKRIQKTYYVAKGQFIGEFEVKDIQEGKIILDYKGQRYELYI